MNLTHLYPYEWKLKDLNFTKDKGKVFSCFSCGGGSTMGYKLAGFDVVGCNEIDPKMMKAYETNHNPKFPYLEPIQTFKLRKDLPKELYELDILDGSPPCSSFSMAGNREKDWGKEKKFREGQTEQILDNLFFDFIDLAKELQPKVIVAENVTGLMMGAAKNYVKKIYNEFINAGYQLKIKPYLLDSSFMIPLLIQNFYQLSFNITKFELVNYPTLKDCAITNYLQEEEDTTLFLDVIHMIETFKIELDYAYIDSRMPRTQRKDIISTMKPFLKDFLLGALSCNPLTRELSRSSALNGLRYFFNRFTLYGTLQYHGVSPSEISFGEEYGETDIEMSNEISDSELSDSEL